ncbi:MAG TPA: hypothetical protein PLS53_05235 [Thermoanaerobaculaceae bacterium]|nr:hypothetical protein [Thermoanaerobaculaceae bacterium]HPS77541.1 hypothetical protein [Thermoanaerobaculaceae bacterium]
MRFLTLLGQGFRTARRHPRLVLIAYLTPLLPALLLVAMARSTLAPALDSSLFAARVLDGRWVGVWDDFRFSPENHLQVVLGSGLGLALLVTLLLQIPLAAGTVEVLLDRDEPERHPFAAGVARHTWPFLRSATWFLGAAAAVTAAVVGTAMAFFKLAEIRANGLLDLVGIGTAIPLALLLAAILGPAYDLARIAIARHGDGATLRGFLRALWLVLRRPGIWLPLYLSFVTLVVALHLGYYAGRRPWTPGSVAAIVALLVAQQLVMAVRAFFHVAFWGSEVAAFHLVGEPRLAKKRQKATAGPAGQPEGSHAASEGAAAARVEPEPPIQVVEPAIDAPPGPPDPA